MLRPQQPHLDDFGLDESDMADLPKSGFIPSIIGIAAGLWIFIYYAVESFNKDHWIGSLLLLVILALVMILPIGLVGGTAYIVSMLLEDALLSRINEKYRRASEYNKACDVYKKQSRDYEAWVRKGREDWWRSLSGVAFEVELGRLFSMMGYEVAQTPATGDGGVDLILRKSGRLTIVQCKAHAKKIPIGVARELSASMLDFKAHEAIIACFEGVTRPVQDYIENKPISVLTVGQIVELQRKYGGYVD